MSERSPAPDWEARRHTLETAVEGVRPGDSVFLGTGCGTPQGLLRALEARALPTGSVQLVYFLTSTPFQDQAGLGRPLRHRAFFVGSASRDLVRQGVVDYVPISLLHAVQIIRTGRIRIDHAFVQVTPPDASGRCSLGISVDVTAAAVAAARRVVAELNPQMPFTAGRSSVPAQRIDAFVEVDTPLQEYVHEPASAVAEQIARYVARLIDDGSTLQVGIGRIPNEMLRFLRNRRDLGVHTDLLTDPMLELVEKGVVTGATKERHRGQVVASYCLGTRRLYDAVDRDERFRFEPIEYVSAPEVVASHRNMVSVTQALAVDLTGQVCADQFEGEFYSGVSTQPEFLRGAAASQGGKPIICLASTTDDGSQSRIRPLLRQGEGATIARSDVHYVVTEYGIAYLFGKSIPERAIALIEIAHPGFREDLLAAAQKLGYLPSSQMLKSRSRYPTEEERRVQLRDGREVLLRPTRAGDVRLMHDLFHALPQDDVYTRFFTNLRSLTTSMAQHLCTVSYDEEMAFAAVVGDFEDEKIVGSSCYYLNHSTNLADVAYMIHPEWQGCGLAKRLQDRMMEYARARDVRGFTADVLRDNRAMLAVFEKSGTTLTLRRDVGTYQVEMLFEALPDAR